MFLWLGLRFFHLGTCLLLSVRELILVLFLMGTLMLLEGLVSALWLCIGFIRELFFVLRLLLMSYCALMLLRLAYMTSWGHRIGLGLLLLAWVC